MEQWKFIGNQMIEMWVTILFTTSLNNHGVDGWLVGVTLRTCTLHSCVVRVCLKFPELPRE